MRLGVTSNIFTCFKCSVVFMFYDCNYYYLFKRLGMSLITSEFEPVFRVTKWSQFAQGFPSLCPESSIPGNSPQSQANRDGRPSNQCDV